MLRSTSAKAIHATEQPGAYEWPTNQSGILNDYSSKITLKYIRKIIRFQQLTEKNPTGFGADSFGTARVNTVKNEVRLEY